MHLVVYDIRPTFVVAPANSDKRLFAALSSHGMFFVAVSEPLASHLWGEGSAHHPVFHNR